MSALTSLLARDRVVPVFKIEEALQQQVLSGGDIETILLEMSLVPEDVLSAYRAALFGLLPATREEIMRGSREARAQMPDELARTLGVVPLLFEGRVLVLAAAEPLSEAVTSQLRAQLGCELSVRIVTQIRLAIGLAHHYGMELDSRSRRLSDSLRKRDPGVIPYVRPPTASMLPGKPSSLRVNAFSEEDSREHTGLTALAAATPPVARTADDEMGVPAVLAETEIPELANDEASGLREASGAAHAAEEPAAEELTVSAAALAAPRPPREGVLSGFQVERSTTVPPSTVSPQIARSVRGPISEERALELLSAATQRDDVLFVLLRYGQQFFDFIAIFSVGKDGARGRMAHGGGLSQELMERIIIPVSGEGVLARSVRDKRVLIGDFRSTDEERAALALLGRPVGRPGLSVPVTIGSRVTLLVYADRLGEGLALEDAAPITRIAPAVSDAFRRIILEQKTLQRGSSRPPAGDLGMSSFPAAPVMENAPASVEPDPAPAALPEYTGGGEPRAEAAPQLEPAEHAASLETLGVAAPDYDTQADGLTPVDLQALARRSLGERRRSVTDTQPVGGTSKLSPEAREAARGRVPGVPRSAPPPPVRESAPPNAGAYSFVSGGGAISEEKIRGSRQLATQPLAFGIRDVREPVPAAPLQAPPANIPAPAPMAATAPVLREPPTESARSEKAASKSPARLSLVTSVAPVPSVIIDMGEHVNSLVQSLMAASPDTEIPQIDELLKVGEGVLPVLIQHFPGPLWFDPKQASRRRPRARDVSAIARCVLAFGDRAAPYLASKLATNDPDVCRYALMVAAEFLHPALLEPVARRSFDSNDAVRASALEVLRMYTGLPQFDIVLRAICELSGRPSKDPRRQRLAVEALCELRDARALATLIERLSDPGEGIAETAHRALVVLTGQDLGASGAPWQSWAEQNRGTHRVEWLIEALAHPEGNMRALASDELKHLTQQYFGYHPGMPRRDRDLAQRKYREWWNAEGKAAFGA